MKSTKDVKHKLIIIQKDLAEIEKQIIERKIPTEKMSESKFLFKNGSESSLTMTERIFCLIGKKDMLEWVLGKTNY